MRYLMFLVAALLIGGQAANASPCIGPETEIASVYNRSLTAQATAQATREGIQEGTMDFLMRLSALLGAPTPEMQAQAEADKAEVQARLDACQGK